MKFRIRGPLLVGGYCGLSGGGIEGRRSETPLPLESRRQVGQAGYGDGRPRVMGLGCLGAWRIGTMGSLSPSRVSPLDAPVGLPPTAISWTDRSVPTGFATVLSAIIGGLVGVLAPGTGSPASRLLTGG